jgi:hypothetical protein
MKKSIFLFLFGVWSIYAQGQSFSKGDHHLHAGIGLINFYYNSSYLGLLPPVNASYEVGIVDLEEVGVIGAGPFVGFSTARSKKYDYGAGEYWWRYTYLTLGARGAWHFDILNDDRFDTYAGLMVGYTITNYSYFDTGSGGSNIDPLDTSGFLNRSLFAGCRYKASDAIRLYGEVGWGFTLLNIGIDLKIK